MIHPISVDESTILPSRDIEGVIHLGAVSNTLERDKSKIDHYNTRFTAALGKRCLELKIPLVFSSSAAVYGNGSGPLNMYAESKLASESDLDGRAMCLRLFNVYGPREGLKGRMASVILRWWNELKSDGTLTIFEGSDHFHRDFVYVRDVCDVMYRCMTRGEVGLHDLGTGSSVSFESIADAVIEEFGSGKKRHIPMPADLVNQYQHNTVAKVCGDIRGTTGWRDGLSLYCDYLRRNCL
jgi:ADP-L-glycero-D-manno-heptose 6-epimerase